MFTFDPSSGSYRDAGGGRVDWSRIRRQYLRAERAAEGMGEVLANQLREGAIPLAVWQTEMRALMKSMHVAAMTLATGGKEMMTPATRGALGGHLAREYRALNNLANRIANGQQPLDGTLWRTARHYIRAARKTYYEGQRRRLRDTGFDQEKSVRTAAERSCRSCIAEEDRGWVNIGSLVPIGDRDCRRNCLCLMYYRNSATGVEVGPF